VSSCLTYFFSFRKKKKSKPKTNGKKKRKKKNRPDNEILVRDMREKKNKLNQFVSFFASYLLLGFRGTKEGG
jgi:uncharacterized membrane protein